MHITIMLAGFVDTDCLQGQPPRLKNKVEKQQSRIVIVCTAIEYTHKFMIGIVVSFCLVEHCKKVNTQTPTINKRYYVSLNFLDLKC